MILVCVIIVLVLCNLFSQRISLSIFITLIQLNRVLNQHMWVNRGILVYIICLISISNSVSDGATNKSVLNIERESSG